VTKQEFEEWLSDMWGEVFEQRRLAKAALKRDASEDYALTDEQAASVSEVISSLDSVLGTIERVCNGWRD